ncbi:hypothetical protein ACJX0J_022662 [Zea mays]
MDLLVRFGGDIFSKMLEVSHYFFNQIILTTILNGGGDLPVREDYGLTGKILPASVDVELEDFAAGHAHYTQYSMVKFGLRSLIFFKKIVGLHESTNYYL